MSNDHPEKPSDIARNIWLAGLGAYGKAIRDAQGKLEEAAREPPRLFRELVEKGIRLEDEVRDSLSSIRKTSGLSVEERIGRVRETFNLSLGRSDELDAVNARLDALEAKLDTLLAAAAKKPARKTPNPKKAVADRKKTARKTPAGKKKAAPAKRKKSPARKAPATRKSAPGKKR